MQTKRVLLIEDNPGDVRLIREMLSDDADTHFEVNHADRLESGLTSVQGHGISVILLDLALPDSFGLETLQRVKTLAPEVPIIVLTGSDDDKMALCAGKTGAQEYLVKGKVDHDTLTRAMRYAIERKHSEEEIRRLNSELEQRVVERTRQLEAANQELRAFAYSVAHDLRAPLRAMDGFSYELLAECGEQLGDRGQGYIARIREAAQRMGRLIDDYLRLSRVIHAELRAAPVDLSMLAAEVAAGLAHTEPDRQVEFNIQPGAIVTGDAGLLRTAL